MASGIVYGYEAAAGATVGVDVTALVVFQRDDRKTDFDRITINVTPTMTPAQINTALTAAIRARATALGYSIAASQLLVPSYVRA